MSTPNGPEWGFYAADSDRSWGWSNHVYTLGYICAGYGLEPDDAWAEALASGRVPQAYLELNPTEDEQRPAVAILASDERTL